MRVYPYAFGLSADGLTNLSSLLYIATGISASLLPRQGNSECAQWCAQNFPHPGSDCTSLAAQGKGPCYECGPAAPQPPTKILCGGKCVPIDNQNCGTCGNVVSYKYKYTGHHPLGAFLLTRRPEVYGRDRMH